MIQLCVATFMKTSNKYLHTSSSYSQRDRTKPSNYLNNKANGLDNSLAKRFPVPFIIYPYTWASKYFSLLSSTSLGVSASTRTRRELTFIMCLAVALEPTGLCMVLPSTIVTAIVNSLRQYSQKCKVGPLRVCSAQQNLHQVNRCQHTTRVEPGLTLIPVYILFPK